MKKTLYVSDMDGTLLLPDRTIGAYTRETVNRLGRKGLLFTVATARSAATVVPMLRGTETGAPLILLNGTVIYDRAQEAYLDACCFRPEVSEALLRRFETLGRNVFVLTLPHLRRENGHGNAIECFYRSLDTQFERDFYHEREPMHEYKRFTQVRSYAGVDPSRVIYFSMTGPEAEMRALCAEVEEKFDVTASLYVDRYDESSYFLEFAPPDASKKNAVLKLKRIVGAERLVVFGDNTNDLGMFSVADECCAVANAIPETKAAATVQIGSNVDEGVAHYLAEQFGK